MGMDYVVDSANNTTTLFSNSFSQIQTGSDGNIVSSSIDFGNTITQYNTVVIPGQIPANVLYDPGSVVVTSTLEGAVPYIDIQARPAAKTVLFVDELVAEVGLVPGGGSSSVGYDIGPVPGRGRFVLVWRAKFTGIYGYPDLGNAAVSVSIIPEFGTIGQVASNTWNNFPGYSMQGAGGSVSGIGLNVTNGNITIDLTASHSFATGCRITYYITQEIGPVESSDYQRQIL